MANIAGTIGNDFVHLNDGMPAPAGYNDLPQATDDADSFTSGGGGTELVHMAGGGDTISFGADLTAADILDGGDGSDTLALSEQTSVTFAANSLTSIETITLANFPVLQNTFGAYTLNFNNANVAASGHLTIDGKALNQDIALFADYAAENDAAAIEIVGGAAGDRIRGRSTFDGYYDFTDLSYGGNDDVASIGIMYFGAAFDSSDRVDGYNNGRIQLYGDYSAGIVLTGAFLKNVQGFILGPAVSNLDPSYNYVFDVDPSAIGPAISSISFDAQRQTAGSGVTVHAADLTGFKAINMIGGAGNETAYGGDGTDYFQLFGAGSDAFYGNGGSDAVYINTAMGADDTLDGGGGRDTAFFSASHGTVTYDGVKIRSIEQFTANNSNSSANFVLTNGALGAGQRLTVDWSYVYQSGGTLSVDGTAETDGYLLVTGGGMNDTLRGGAIADRLDGYAGNDSLQGGGGVDTLIGGLGNDTYVNPTGDIVTELANQGTDTVESNVAFSLESYANIERLFLTGNNAINATGNALGNHILGNVSANALTGLGGNDSMNGGNGNDTFTGGDGADTLIGGSGDDTFVNPTGDSIVEAAGGGTDTVQSSVSFSLAALTYVERLFLTGASAIDGNGNALANFMQGNGAANVLNGFDGDDTLQGSGGADRLNGSTGADNLTGGSGADRIAPGADTQIDTVRVATPADSTGPLRDVIIGFDANAEDLLDLSVRPTAFNGSITTGTLNEASFNADLQSIVNAAKLSAGNAVVFNPNAGTADYANTVYLIVDANGIAGYQANQDYVFQVEAHAGAFDITDFAL